MPTPSLPNKVPSTLSETNLFFADEFSTEFGNPFSKDRNTLSAGSGCESFNCGPNNANCYSRPSMKRVYGCPEPVNLTATICKK